LVATSTVAMNSEVAGVAAGLKPSVASSLPMLAPNPGS